MRDFLPKLEAAFDAADIACLLIAAPEGCADEALSVIAKPLIETAQQRDAAALLTGSPELAKTLQADGVHLDLTSAATDDLLRHYRYARKILGPDFIVGMQGPAERHGAMEVADAGADYVGFNLDAPEAIDLLTWWTEMMTVPCVAFGDFDATQAGRLAADGADFLAPGWKLWSKPDPAHELAALGHAVAPSSTRAG